MQIKQVFLEELELSLCNFEKTRQIAQKELLFNKKVYFLGCILLLLSLVFLITKVTSFDVVFILFGVAIFVLQQTSSKIKEIPSNFKASYKELLQQFSSQLYPELNYAPNESITTRRCIQSFFLPIDHKFIGEDFFKGTISHDFEFECCELIQSDIYPVDPLQNLKNRRFFTIIQCPQHSFDAVLILPQNKRKQAGFLSNKITYDDHQHYDRISTKEMHPSFYKDFEVLTATSVDTNALLSVELLDIFCFYLKEYKCYLQMSFIGNQVFMAIPIRKNFFEYRMTQVFVPQKTTKAVAQEFEKGFGLIDQVGALLTKVRIGDKAPLKSKDNSEDDAYDHFDVYD